jgi:hypothetical protein
MLNLQLPSTKFCATQSCFRYFCSACIDPAFCLLCVTTSYDTFYGTFVAALSPVTPHTAKRAKSQLLYKINFMNDSPTVLQAVVFSVLSAPTAEQPTINPSLLALSKSYSHLTFHYNSCHNNNDIS